MSDLTREEIRAACEAVGWEWHEREKPPGKEIVHEDFDYAIDSKGATRFHPAHRWSILASSFSLIEATGDRWQEGRSISEEEPYFAFVVGHPHGFGSTLTAARVRAINAWAESRKESR